MSVQTKYFALRGSLDLSTAPIALNPGNALEAVNYIPGLEGGYRRIGGYERFDGRPQPSAAQFWELELSSTAGISAGDSLTGQSSGAVSTIIAVSSDNRVAVVGLQGSYQHGESANGVLIHGVESLMSANTDDEFDQWRHLAANHYRSAIGKVPGSGPIRGVFRHLDKTYAFRDSADGSRALAYQASSMGWQLLAMPVVVKFAQGTGAARELDIVQVGSTSAVIKRIFHTSGSWGAGDAEGHLVVEVLQGNGFAAGDQLQVDGKHLANATEDSKTFSLKPGGRFEFDSYNFSGDNDGYRVYGCDGVNPAFEIDQAGLISPLYSKHDEDNPSFVRAHANRLFIGFAGGQYHHSVVGEPWNYTVSLGAGQSSLGADITGMLSQPGGALAITTSRRTFILHGSSNADFVQQVAAQTAGAYPYTLQSVSEVFALDDQGVIQLSRTAAFGGFESGTVTRKVQSLINRLKSKAIGSTVVRRFNQYWVFFSDGTGLACYPVSSAAGTLFLVTQINYGRAVRCVCNAEDELGQERIFFGSDDGYIYEAEMGTSFDGQEIEAFIRLPFNHFNSPRVKKRWRRFILELEASGPVTLSITPDLDYSSPTVGTALTADLSAYGGGGYWDSSSWDQFTWDAEAVSVPEMMLTGSGLNIGFLIHQQSATSRSYTLQGVTIHYEPRRLQRS